MNSREIICRVRALYAYESNDPSSLSFQANAIIDVLAQLESGWWDGWCDGRRGWFPSNYVEVLQEDQTEEEQLWELQQWRSRQQQSRSAYQRPQQQQQQEKNQLRLSLNVNDSLIQPKSDWVLQTTEDGSEQYYYNPNTQEMRYSIPPEGFITEDIFQQQQQQQQQQEPDIISRNNNHHHHQQQQETFERPVRPARAANRVVEDMYSQHQINTPLPYRNNNNNKVYQSDEDIGITGGGNGDEKLPPNWTRKVTPKGRFYYCNIKTEETTWSLENIDPDTGLLLTDPLSSPKNFISEEVRTIASHEATVTPMSWNSLSTNIAQAIYQLKDAITHNNTAITEHTTAIVQAVRFLLYASGCLDKDTSIHLNNKTLRNQHRSLLASLAKLVLSSKVASAAWHTPESRQKLQSDADDLLVSTRDFVTCAQDLQIEIKSSKPQLIISNTLKPSKNNNNNNNNLHHLKPEAVLGLAENSRVAMASYIDSIHDALYQFKHNNDLKGTLEKLGANAPLLVAQFRNVSNTTSHLLNFIEELPRSASLDQAKQPIYSAMGSLFIISQTITNAHLNAAQMTDISQRLDHHAQTIEMGIRNVLEAIQKPSDDILDSVIDNSETKSYSFKENNGNGSIKSSSHSVLGTESVHSDALLEDNEGNEKSRNSVGKEAVLKEEEEEEEDDDEGEESQLNNANRRVDIGLGTLMANPSVHSSILNGGSSTDDISLYSSESNSMLPRPQKEIKINKFFGEETIAAARRRDTALLSPTTTTTSTGTTVITSASGSVATGYNNLLNSDQPWYLQSDIDPLEIVFNMEGHVKGGTLRALVTRLTQHDQLDSKFNTTFLLTYRSFCTTEELFAELFNRYVMEAPEGLTKEETETWREQKLKLVRLRMFNVMKSWLETYFNEEEDHSILPILEEFTRDVISVSMSFGADQLTKLIKKRMLAEDNSQIKKMKLNVRTADMPAPILPKNMKRIRLLEVDPLELARQMTIMDFRLYNRIKPVECLDKNWGKPDMEGVHHIAANVKASIEHSNQVTAWVTDSILSKEEIKKRAVVVKHWIFVAERCRLLNNFNTCMAILSAFDNGSIGRLKRTWELISTRSMQTLSNIRRLMGANRNFSEYRDIIHKINPPCIPFLGIYLQDLTFIEDGNSNFLKKSNNLINFAKRMKTAEVIVDLQQYQSAHYMLTAVPDIQEFIKTHLHSSREEEELYNLSLKLEPRERGEDTIARRLKESGL